MEDPSNVEPVKPNRATRRRMSRMKPKTYVDDRGRSPSERVADAMRDLVGNEKFDEIIAEMRKR